MINIFVNQLHKNNKSSATIRKVVNILRGALEQAVINKIISENVVRGVRLPKHEAKEVSWFSEEEELRFKKAAEGDRLENFFKLGFLSGLRSGELLGLKWDAVDLKNGIIHVKRILMRHKDYITRKNKYEIVNTTKTIGSRRSIPIPPSAVKLLKQHKKQQEKEKRLAGDLYQDSNLVFCTALGNRLLPRNVDRSFKRIANKAGIPNVQVHSIRHTYATRLFERGVPAKIVSQLLGHKDVSHTLNIYTHVTHRLTSDAVMVLEYFSDNNFDNNATENRGYYGAIGENTAPPQPPQELH